jgi:hypothetical protein
MKNIFLIFSITISSIGAMEDKKSDVTCKPSIVKPHLDLTKLAQIYKACVEARVLEEHWCRTFIKAHIEQDCGLQQYNLEENECVHRKVDILDKEMQKLQLQDKKQITFVV